MSPRELADDMQRIINSQLFSLTLCILVFFAQTSKTYSKPLTYVVSALGIALGMYVIMRWVTRMTFSFRCLGWKVVAEEVVHVVIMRRRDGVTSYHFYSLHNRTKSAVRDVINDYEGGRIESSYKPTYTFHHRTKLPSATVTPDIGDESIQTVKKLDYATGKTIELAEWPVDVAAPLQPDEEIQFSRKTRQKQEDVTSEEIAEFSFRPRVPTRSLKIILIPDALTLRSVSVLSIDQAGKTAQSYGKTQHPLVFSIDIPLALPSMRYVTRFDVAV